MSMAYQARVSRGIFFFAAVLLMAGLAGCGGESVQKPPVGGGTGTDDGPAKPAQPAQPAAKAEDTLARIKEAGVLKWGADAAGGAPFVFQDPEDTTKVIGFEMDLMDAFAKHMGVKPERVQGEWKTLPGNLTAKRTDVVVNGFEINEERKKIVAFSEPYYVYEQQLTVRIEDKDKYKTLADLKGKKIGTLDAAQANNVLNDAGFPDELLEKGDDSQTPYTNLEVKRTEAVLQESIIAEYYAGKNAKLYNVPQTFAPGKYAVLVRLEDTTLLTETNRILADMKKNGELAAIYKKWNIMNDKQKEIGVEAK